MSAFDIALYSWLVLSAPISFLGGMIASAQNRGEWIENVGVCPVPTQMRVDVMLPANLVVKNVVAGDWMWLKNPAMLSEKLTIKFWRIAS